MKTAQYGRWGQCIRLENGRLELLVTRERGPRVIRLGFIGGRNLFREFPEDAALGGDDRWKIYGGHRLWHAPEMYPRTYVPDNGPVDATGDGRKVVLTQETEKRTGIQKVLAIEMSEDENRVTVTHTLTNRNLWEVELAVWALSVMSEGGLAVIPQEPYSSHSATLTPVRPMALWAYTDMNDPRWRWGRKYVSLKQVPGAPPTKAGFGNSRGWCSYLLDDLVFLKCFRYIPGAVYPDFGSSVELFTNENMLELESLGPLVRLAPDEAVTHTEYWGLFKDLQIADTDDSLDEILLPLVEEILEV
ncbi:MAG TPA: hypothetical protein VLH40_05650 [Atribacteraceae bacterium]|nr:hypothetical protein [Atribacteraceae bacterium]